jgi:hypothetical protein
MLQNQGDIQTEVDACLALAKAFDMENLRCPPHSNEYLITNNDNETFIDNAEGETEKLARISFYIAEICRGRPMDQKHLDRGYTRKSVIYLLACNAYQLAKNIHKESFIFKESSVSTESCKGSLTIG